MQPISSERYYAAIEAAAGTLAGLVQDADLTRQVPTCPDWTLRQLATHVGRAHRWAAEIVSTRSADFIPFRSVPDGRLPDDPAQHGTWLTAGADRLAEAVRSADDAPVWTFGGMQPASFWARRMTHETVVHTADAELAAGLPAQIAPDIAADGIDEWLGLLSGPRYQPAETPVPALAAGRTLHLHATGARPDGNSSGSASPAAASPAGASPAGASPAGAGEWLVTGTGTGITVRPGHSRADVALAGPAAVLLLVLVRRLTPEDPRVQVHGDADLLAQWLEQTPF